MIKPLQARGARFGKRWLWTMLAFMVVGIMGANGVGPAEASSHEWSAFGFLSDPTYSWGERIALIANVLIACAGLYYAWMLVNEVYGADTGTDRMKEIA